MTTTLSSEKGDHAAILRDHLYRHGPCTVAEAARATGLRVRHVSSLLSDGSLTQAHSAPVNARCSICRSPTEVGDLCRRCRDDLQSSQRPQPESERSHRPSRGGGMRSRR